MFYFAASFIGIIAALPFIMWARHQTIPRIVPAAGLGLGIVAGMFLFFAMGKGNGTWKMIELLGLMVFGSIYWVKVRSPLMLLGWMWMLHACWDVFLHLLGPGSYLVPAWYLMACAVLNIVIGVYLFWREYARRHPGARIHIV